MDVAGPRADSRVAELLRLMEQRQLLDPFGLLVYAELAGAELSPVGLRRAGALDTSSRQGYPVFATDDAGAAVIMGDCNRCALQK